MLIILGPDYLDNQTLHDLQPQLFDCLIPLPILEAAVSTSQRCLQSGESLAWVLVMSVALRLLLRRSSPQILRLRW